MYLKIGVHFVRGWSEIERNFQLLARKEFILDHEFSIGFQIS